MQGLYACTEWPGCMALLVEEPWDILLKGGIASCESHLTDITFMRPQLSMSVEWICSLWYSVRAVDESWVALVQALALMAAFRDEWPCMIIVPSSLRGDRRFARLLCMQAQALDAALTPGHFHHRRLCAGRALPGAELQRIFAKGPPSSWPGRSARLLCM